MNNSVNQDLGGRKTFCQIVGQDVGITTCLQTQGQKGCFGCASSFRLCESCRKRIVVVPAVGLCSVCLKAELIKEKETPALISEYGRKVKCQIFKRLIKPEMCQATQGQNGCKDCSAQTRLCEACKIHICRFPNYGYCLTCAVKELGDGWTPDQVNQIDLAYEEEIIKMANNSSENGTNDQNLLEKARQLTLSSERISALRIQKELRIPYTRASKLLLQLEQEGIVGPIDGARPRVVIRKPSYGESSVCAIHNCGLPTFAGIRGFCKKHTLEFYGGKLDVDQTFNNRSRKVTSVLPQVIEFLANRRVVQATEVLNHFTISRALAWKIAAILEEEGFVGKYDRRAGYRTVLIQNSDFDSTLPVESNSLLLDSKISRVKNLIQVLGEETEIGIILNSLITDVFKLEEIRLQLRSLSQS